MPLFPCRESSILTEVVTVTGIRTLRLVLLHNRVLIFGATMEEGPGLLSDTDQGGNVSCYFVEGRKYNWTFPVSFVPLLCVPDIYCAGASSGTLGAYLTWNDTQCVVTVDEGGYRPTVPVYILAFGHEYPRGI